MEILEILRNRADQILPQIESLENEYNRICKAIEILTETEPEKPAVIHEVKPPKTTREEQMRAILRFMAPTFRGDVPQWYSVGELAAVNKTTKSDTVRMLNRLIQAKRIVRRGKSRATQYALIPIHKGEQQISSTIVWP